MRNLIVWALFDGAQRMVLDWQTFRLWLIGRVLTR